MTSTQLKRHLLDNPSLIIDILESLGCHGIKHVKNRRIMCALPDGDNETSVQVLIEDEGLITIVHTRGDYTGGDIFEFVSYIKGCSFRNSLMYICRVVNVEFSTTYKPAIKNETYNFLNKFTRREMNSIDYENQQLDDTVLDEYIKTAHQMFLDDHLSIESQYKFNIHYDIHGQRILIPIRDTEGNLVSIKGRASIKNHKEQRVEKYIAYYPYKAKSVLYGYYENYWDILSCNEVILVESEKAVIQADSYGVNNVIALSKKKISDEQLYKIISLNVNVVLAFDKDVKHKELEIIANEFKGLCSVYTTYDTDDLLGEKDSPFDRGSGTWYKLYENRKQIL